MRKSKKKYLQSLDCPRCGQRGKLYGRFQIVKDSYYFADFEVLHSNTGQTCYFGRIFKI